MTGANWQLTFVSAADIAESKQREDKELLFCKWHKWATEKDFIEVANKKTQEKTLRCMFCEHQKAQNKLENKQIWATEKQQLTDYYIRRLFVIGRGKTKLRMHEYPQELVEVKRAALRIKRAVDDAAKPLMVCREHGDLFRENVVKRTHDTWRCKECLREAHRRHYLAHQAKVRAKHTNYRRTNPQKIKESRKKYRQKHLKQISIKQKLYRINNLEKIRKKEKDYYDRQREKLSDVYIKSLLVKHAKGLSLRHTHIPQELIEVKRVVVRLQNAIKVRKFSYPPTITEELPDGKS